jgi:Flp pilus assembly protein TadB
MWMPAAITCGVLVLACLAIARMAHTVEQRLIDVDLAQLGDAGHRTARSDDQTGGDHDQRAERLRSIANHHRVADYLIIAVLGIVVVNAVLYVMWVLPAVLSLPVILLLLVLAVTAAWVVRRTPSYDMIAAGAADPDLGSDR